MLELEDGDRRRFLVLLFLVELQKPVVVVLLLLLLAMLIFLLPSAASSSSSSYAVASVRNPVVVPRIQIPRLLGLRYCCFCSSNARPSTSPDPITRRGVGD